VNPKKFLTDLKRRNIHKVAADYVIVNGLVMQIANVT
jgi:hypothetical protein